MSIKVTYISIMNNIKRFQILFTIITVIALAIWTIVILWAADKGFDVSDEGFYMYKYSSLNASRISFTNFHLLQQFLFPFVEPTIYNLRIEKLLLCFVGSAVFSFSIFYYLKHVQSIILKGLKILSLYVVILSGFTLTYAFGPQTPAYNFFSSFFVVLATALFIVDLSKQQSTVKVVALYLLIGAFCECLFLAKFTNAIVLPLVFFIVYVVYAAQASNNKVVVLKFALLRLVLLFTGYFITHLLVCGGWESGMSFYLKLASVIDNLRGHDNNTLIDAFIATFTTVYHSLCTVKFILFTASLVAALWAFFRGNNYLFYAFVLLHILVIYQFKLYYGGEANKTEQTIGYFLWIIALAVIYIIRQKRQNILNTAAIKQHILLYLLLFFIPIASVLGTNNQLQIQVIFYMPLWLVLLYLLIPASTKKTIIITVFVLLTTVQSIDAVVYHPYRISGTLLEQNQPLTIGEAETIYVDKSYKEGVVALDSALKANNYTNRDYLFYFSEISGLAYLLHQQLPPYGTDSYSPDNKEEYCTVLQNFQKSNPDARLFFVMDSNYPTLDSLFSCIAVSNYYKAGEVSVRFNNYSHKAAIYAPR